MKAFAMLSIALLITSCIAMDNKSSDKDKNGLWDLTLKLGDDFDDPQTDAPATKKVVTEKVPRPVEVDKKVQVKEVIKPVIVEKKVLVHVDRPVPYPVKVVQKEYIKVPYPVFVKKPIYIERQSQENYRNRDYHYRQKQWGLC
uniref:Uncharacterized protein n=1 Tax=Culex quinquefasciatus TaxID=7176 RepID=A0A1S4KID7_CULQU